VTGVDGVASRSSGLAASAGRAREWLRAVPTAVWIVLGGAVVLRLALWYAYSPAIVVNHDTAAYVEMARAELFADPARTTGYSVFLRGLHAIWGDLDLVIAVQHLIGIATALILYATVRRLGAPLWAALASAAAILLSLDQVAIEHTVLSESPFTFTFCAALYFCVRSLDEPREVLGPLTNRHLWAVAAGLALGLDASLRGTAAPMIPFLGLWFLFAIPGRWLTRFAYAGAATISAGVLVLAYAAINDSVTGHFGLTKMSGWTSYARAAPFADCTQFDPPAGTERLCEATPSEERPGPDFYTWEPESPAQRVFGYPPAGNDLLGEFGRQAIVNQPLDYGWSVTRDFLRFYAPDMADERPFSGPKPDYNDIGRRDPPIEQDLMSRLNGYYAPEELTIREGAVEVLTNVQQFFRVHPVLLLQATLLGALGLWLAADRRTRAGVALLLGAGLLLLAIPAVVGTYNSRYALPAGGPLIAAGAIGLWLLIERLRGRSIAGGGPAAAETGH
jgi:4-amino-4-deoxy-L-arabinose transferase-like glycosyltransferase